MTSIITDVVDYIVTMFSGDIGTAKCPLLFQTLHAILLGCMVRPVIDKRPNGERRYWLTSLVLYVMYMLGGSTITATLVGKRPGLLASNLGWMLYALGWFVGGFDQVRHFVLKTPAKFVFLAGHALSRTIFVSSDIIFASGACPGGLLVIIIPIMNTHSADWICYPIFTAIEGKHFSNNKDWIYPSPGLRNTFWAATLYFIISGRAFGCFLPEHLRMLLANIAVCAPLMYDAIINVGFGSGTSILGLVEAPFGILISFIENFRDKKNEEFNKKSEEKPVEDNKQEEQQQQDENNTEDKKNQ